MLNLIKPSRIRRRNAEVRQKILHSPSDELRLRVIALSIISGLHSKLEVMQGLTKNTRSSARAQFVIPELQLWRFWLIRR
jgi:hypothetical protein